MVSLFRCVTFSLFKLVVLLNVHSIITTIFVRFSLKIYKGLFIPFIQMNILLLSDSNFFFLVSRNEGFPLFRFVIEI